MAIFDEGNFFQDFDTDALWMQISASAHSSSSYASNAAHIPVVLSYEDLSEATPTLPIGGINIYMTLEIRNAGLREDLGKLFVRLLRMSEARHYVQG